jgi:hypothetical protein
VKRFLQLQLVLKIERTILQNQDGQLEIKPTKIQETRDLRVDKREPQRKERRTVKNSMAANLSPTTARTRIKNSTWIKPSIPKMRKRPKPLKVSGSQLKENIALQTRAGRHSGVKVKATKKKDLRKKDHLSVKREIC